MGRKERVIAALEKQKHGDSEREELKGINLPNFPPPRTVLQ